MKNAHIYKIATLVALISSTHQTAFAQDSLDEIFVTAERYETTTDNFTGSASVIDSAALAETAATHIQESLAALPGVNLHRNSGQEYLPAVRSPVLSGAGACGSVLMAEDGIALRPAGFCNVNELFESNWQQAQRIEVIRGPSSALYGSNALHGVINVVTPNSADNTIAVEAGSLDYYRTKISAGNDTSALFFTGTQDQGFRDDYGVDEQKLTLKHQQALGDINVLTGLTAVNLNQETAGYIVGTDSYKDRDIAESNPNPEAYRDAKAVRLWTRLSSQESNRSWQVTPYLRYSDMAFLQHFLPGTPLEENGQKSLGVQSSFRIKQDNSQFIVGLDAEYVDGWLKQSQSQATQGSAFLVATIPAGIHYDYEVEAIQVAPFALWKQQLNDQWAWSAGVRYEWMQYDYNNLSLDGRTRDDGTECGFGGCRYSRPADSTDSFSNLSPNLDASYQIDDQQRVFLALAQGFRAPQAVELYRLQREQQITDLDPEELQSIELGYRWQSAGLQLELTAYDMRKENVIYRNSDFFTIAAGKTRHRGIELALSAQLSEQLRVALAATQAKHTYNHNDTESGIVKGNYVDTAPKRFGNASVHWDINTQLGLSVQWQHMGSYFTDPANDHRYNGHNIVNLRGHYRLSDALTLRARVVNLTDKRYADRADYSGFAGDRYFPGSPRAAFVEAQFSW